MAGDVYTELAWRGMVYEGTEGVRDALSKERVTCYIGFDPTAPSLHVGSLLPMMVLARLQRFGHRPIAIVGGGTGLIGDPSGRTQERQLLAAEQVEENAAGIRAQLARVLDFGARDNPAAIVNNADWLTKLDLMDFLRDVGKHFTVNYLLAKESVKRRLDSEDGISYTEFSYLLLQAYDFLMMFDRYQCTLQLGGSDQWGNIVAGCDLIRKLRGGRAHGLVLPLVTTTSGVKFGKTEAGALWLDPARTAPYEFYQFWINTDDRDVGRYLKYFTFLEEAEIAALEAEHARAPERRTAQRRLASEVTVLVHGEEAARGAEEESGRRFGGGTAADRIRALVESGSEPAIELRATELGPRPLVRILTTTGLATSASEAARLIRAGAVRVNDERVTDERKQFGSEDTHEGLLLVARGGRRVCAVKLVFPGAEVRPEGA